MAENVDEATKGGKFLVALAEAAKSDAATAAKFTYQELYIDYNVWKQLKLLGDAADPKKAGIVITAMVVQKAMAAANIQTKEETKACLTAVARLASDFALAATLGPATLGVGSLLPLALAAVDAYDVGQSCFVTDGGTTHAVVGSVRQTLKVGLKSSKHGPI